MNKFLDIIKGFLGKKKFKYGTNAVILTVIVIAIVILINVFAGMITWQWDLTPNKLYSLSDVSKEILSNVEKDVVIYGLFDEVSIKNEVSNYTEAVELLSLYEKYGIKVEFIDPVKEPGIIARFDPDNILGIEKYNFVVVCQDKTKVLTDADLFEYDYSNYYYYGTPSITGSNTELAFTGAVKFVTAETTPTIYFTTGHGEADIDSNYTGLKEILENNNYLVKELNLFNMDEIPADTAVLVVASPSEDISPVESNMIDSFVMNGGKALFMFDYNETLDKMGVLEQLLAGMNIGLNYDKVKENNAGRHLSNDQFTFAPYIESTDISSILTSILPSYSSNLSNYMMLMNNATSIRVLRDTKDYYCEVIPLLTTSEQAAGLPAEGGSENEGPLTLGAAVKVGYDEEYYSKVVVLGNSAFISDSVKNIYPNYYIRGIYYCYSIICWLDENKDDVVISTKAYETAEIDISATQASIMGIVAIGLIPLIIAGIGLFVYLRRRHL